MILALVIPLGYPGLLTISKVSALEIELLSKELVSINELFLEEFNIIIELY